MGWQTGFIIYRLYTLSVTQGYYLPEEAEFPSSHSPETNFKRLKRISKNNVRFKDNKSTIFQTIFQNEPTDHRVRPNTTQAGIKDKYVSPKS